MHLKIAGIVLKQKKSIGEQKYLTLLTSQRGIIDVKLRIFGKINKNITRNVNVLGYYYFDIFDGNHGYIVDSAETIESFFNLRYCPEKLALAQYFCELTYLLVPSKQRALRHLKLLLNSLWLLEKDRYSRDFIKCVFELRLLSLSGYMPNLVGCKICCNYEKELMFYVPFQGELICSDCLENINQKHDIFKLTKPVLYAMRYIIYKDDKDIFKFKINHDQLEYLSNLIEKIVLIFTEKELSTLKIYHQFNEEFR